MEFLLSSLFSIWFWIVYFFFGLVYVTIHCRFVWREAYNWVFLDDVYYSTEDKLFVGFTLITLGLFWPLGFTIFIVVLFFRGFFPLLRFLMRKIDNCIPDIEFKF